MSLIHCHDCKKDFVCITVSTSRIANNVDIECEYCHSTCTEILAEDEFMRSGNAVNTGEIVSILRQEYDNIMNMWNEDEGTDSEVIDPTELNQTDTELEEPSSGPTSETPEEDSEHHHYRSVHQHSVIWDGILRYILHSGGEVIDNISMIIRTIDPEEHNSENHNCEIDSSGLEEHSLHNNRHIFVIAILDLLHQEMEIPVGPIPASKDFIKNIPKFRLKSEDIKNMSEEKCAICYEEFKNGKTCMKLPCNHVYHSICIKKWFKEKNTCPACRSKVPTDNRDYNMYHKISDQFKISRDITNYNG